MIATPRPTWTHRRAEIALLLVPALTLGAIARFVPIANVSFPLNDGGLFYVMSQDLVRLGFALPDVTSYNNAGIPFAYPPLALYALGILSAAGLDAIQLLRWIPFVVSVMTIPLVYLVAKELLGSWRIAGVAALAFALIPRSYEWTITGGGLTRGLGMAMALLAIWQGLRLIRTPNPMHVALTGLFGGLTVLTHPEASLFVVITLGTFVAAFGRTIRTAMAMVIAGIIGGLVSAPWWLSILLLHGPGLLVGAADSRTAQLPNALRNFLFGDFTGASALDIFLGIGFVGLLVQVGRGRYVLPVWLLGLVIFIVAAGFTFAAVPWAMLTAIAVMEVVLPSAGRLFPAHVHARAIVTGGLLGAGMLATLATGYSTATPIHGLSPEQRSAMQWINESLPPDARFVVVTGVDWPKDATSEWFPAL
ncbi:MAG TPA: glycosyltransferase family 39 protein, partial [Hyphomicrobiaceae bacterium]